MKVTTLAGQPGKSGYKDGKGTEAMFYSPSSIAADSVGNLYITDTGNYRIRRMSMDGTVSTVAGTGVQGYRDGKAEEAQFGNCFGLAVGENGTVFVADSTNHVIRRVKDGEVSTLAGKAGECRNVDGKGEEARFNIPNGICMSSDGCLLVTDSGDSSVRKVTMDGVVTTLVGNGKGDKDGDLSQAQFNRIYGICTNGEDIYVADHGADSVRKISEGRVVSLKVETPISVCFLGGTLFTLSYSEHRIYQGENFEPFAGSGKGGHRDGTLLEAHFLFPWGIVGSNCSLYVADRGNHCIRRIPVFVEWRPDTHRQTPKQTRDAVKTLMMMRKRSDSLWNGVPRDVVFLICTQLHQLSWT